jgi:DNA polymerase III alpha subunit (gram-positive type)
MLYLISKGIDKIEAFKIMEFIRKNKNSKPLPEK